MIRCASSARLAVSLIERLAYEPASLYRAELGEDQRLYGWGPHLESHAVLVEEIRALRALIINMFGQDTKTSQKVVEPYQGRPQEHIKQMTASGKLTARRAQPATLADVQGFLAQM